MRRQILSFNMAAKSEKSWESACCRLQFFLKFVVQNSPYQPCLEVWVFFGQLAGGFHQNVASLFFCDPANKNYGWTLFLFLPGAEQVGIGAGMQSRDSFAPQPITLRRPVSIPITVRTDPICQPERKALLGDCQPDDFVVGLRP